MKKVWLLVMLALYACDSNRLYEYNLDFEEKAWIVSDTPRFEFEIKDPSKTYNLYCNIRNTIDFPYLRIFVQYRLSDSLNNELEKELISAYLFDEKTGAPKGSSSIGDIYDHQLPLITNYQFARPGKYFVSLEQFNRQDTLKGVLAVGVRVELAEAK